MRPALIFSLALPVIAQSAGAQRSLDGFQRLRVGRWEDAFQEWTREGLLGNDEADALLATCLKAVPANRTLGQVSTFHEPLNTHLWERHYFIATFDGAALFLVFDWVRHKEHWRLQRLQVVNDPSPFLNQSIRSESR
jgi:hypothetical protein